jgi:hypothetical protein
MRVLGSGPSLKFGCEGPQCIGSHENPYKTNFFLYKIVGLPDNETKAIVKLFSGAKLVLNH